MDALKWKIYLFFVVCRCSFTHGTKTDQSCGSLHVLLLNERNYSVKHHSIEYFIAFRMNSTQELENVAILFFKRKQKKLEHEAKQDEYQSIDFIGNFGHVRIAVIVVEITDWKK